MQSQQLTIIFAAAMADSELFKQDNFSYIDPDCLG